MADKTKSDFPPDAIPRRYQANLVPPSAAGVPDPIREASEQLRVSALAAERAFTERRSAEAAAKAAPRLNSQAGIEAVKRGEDPPPATAPEREREAEVARQRERAQNAIAQTASIALERAIREHCGGWVEPQRSDAVAIAQEALADVDALEAQLERLAASAGIVASLQTVPTGRVIEHGRMFKPRTVGFNAQDGTKSHPAGLAVGRAPRSDRDDGPGPGPGRRAPHGGAGVLRPDATRLPADGRGRCGHPRQSGLRDGGWSAIMNSKIGYGPIGIRKVLR